MHVHLITSKISGVICPDPLTIGKGEGRKEKQEKRRYRKGQGDEGGRPV
jgi:hypothetical protein